MAGATHGCGRGAVSYGCIDHFAGGVVGDDFYVSGGWQGGSSSRCDPVRGQQEWAVAFSVPEPVVAVSEDGCASRRCIQKTGQFRLLEERGGFLRLLCAGRRVRRVDRIAVSSFERQFVTCSSPSHLVHKSSMETHGSDVHVNSRELCM